MSKNKAKITEGEDSARGKRKQMFSEKKGKKKGEEVVSVLTPSCNLYVEVVGFICVFF